MPSSLPRFMRRKSAGLLSRKASFSELLKFVAERAVPTPPETAAMPKLTVNFPKNAGHATLLNSCWKTGLVV